MPSIDGLCLGEDVGNVCLTGDEHEDDHEMCDVVTQAFCRPKDVLGFLERHRVEGEVDATLGVGEAQSRIWSQPKQETGVDSGEAASGRGINGGGDGGGRGAMTCCAARQGASGAG